VCVCVYVCVYVYVCVCVCVRERECGGDWEFRRVFTPIYSRQYIHTNFTQLM
jgi:hypothetical protein